MDTLQKNAKKKPLRDQVQQIADMYFLALKHIKLNMELKDNVPVIDKYKEYVAKVRKAFHTLDGMEQTVINNEFFYQAYPLWWKGIYPRSTFYRIKRKSMMKFKEAFDDAY